MGSRKLSPLEQKIHQAALASDDRVSSFLRMLLPFYTQYDRTCLDYHTERPGKFIPRCSSSNRGSQLSTVRTTSQDASRCEREASFQSCRQEGSRCVSLSQSSMKIPRPVVTRYITSKRDLSSEESLVLSHISAAGNEGTCLFNV